MEIGEIPRDWKRANVSPIFKKGPRNNAENYRPISLMFIVCKLMESFVKEKIMSHILEEKLLSPKQYGLISGRSITTQLLKYLDNCIETIVSGGVVDAIYLDFVKAFDTVPHQRLLKKLEAYGTTDHILTLIKGFLSDRSQVVIYFSSRTKRDLCCLSSISTTYRRSFRPMHFSSRMIPKYS